MSRHTLSLTLVAALAASALAVPAALARPTDSLSPQARNAAATAATASSDRVQDLRRLRAQQSRRIPTTTESQFTPGYTPSERRGREAYYDGTPPAAQQPARTVSTDDGAPWTMIALGLGGAGLVLIAMLIARRARLRTHIAA
jgi:hypothetical protein